MKTALALLAAVLVAAAPAAQAQPRVYTQAELDALLAPVALHPDGLLSQILIAATYPEEVAAAADWSRANPHLRGDDAVRAVDYEPWDPAVKALVAFPDILARMDESPQWLHDLGQAFLYQEPHVMDTVQGLRQRAQAAGYLSSSEQQAVYTSGDAIVVEPRTQFVYVRYYDPYVVYGPWWWPHYHPVFWRPWAIYPVFVTRGFFYARPQWHHRHVQVVHRPVHVTHHQHRAHVAPGKWQHRPADARPRTNARPQARVPENRQPAARQSVRVPEAQRRPIVQQHQQQMPAANGFSRNVQRKAETLQQRIQQNHTRAAPQIRQEMRREAAPQARGHANGQPRGNAFGHSRGQGNAQRQSNSGRQHRG